MDIGIQLHNKGGVFWQSWQWQSWQRRQQTGVTETVHEDSKTRCYEIHVSPERKKQSTSDCRRQSALPKCQLQAKGLMNECNRRWPMSAVVPHQQAQSLHIAHQEREGATTAVVSTLQQASTDRQTGWKGTREQSEACGRRPGTAKGKQRKREKRREKEKEKRIAGRKGTREKKELTPEKKRRKPWEKEEKPWKKRKKRQETGK